MRVSLFGRPRARSAQHAPRTGAPRPHPKGFPEGIECGAGCGRKKGFRCSYKDLVGRRCAYWCEEHSVFLNGRMWCERHANSVKWLRARDGSIYEIGTTAAIDDRSPNLVGILVDELNREMTAHLTEVFDKHKGVFIVTDANVRTASIPKGRVDHTPDGPRVLHETGQTAWQRGWGVYSHVGYLARVVLTVTSTEPPARAWTNRSASIRRTESGSGAPE